jgi:hypothetical protein
MMMLRQARVVTKLKDAVKITSIGEAHATYVDISKNRGGTEQIKLLTYNPLTQKFLFQTPSYFRIQQDSKQAVSLKIDMRVDNKAEDNIAIAMLGHTDKILIKLHNMPTSMSVLGLHSQQYAKLAIAYMDNWETDINNYIANKAKISFKKIKGIGDEVRTAPTVFSASGQNENPGKRHVGRPRKSVEAIKPVVAGKESDNDIFRLESRDGAMFVSNGLITQ